MEFSDAAAFLFTTAVRYIFLWEVLFQISALALRRGLGEKISLNQSKLPLLLVQGPSYFVSFIHSLILGLRGVKHLMDFAPLNEPILQYSKSLQKEGIAYAVMMSNGIFLGYLLFDLYHILRLYPKIGGIDMVLHHLVFVTCSVINGCYLILPLTFAWLIVGEISTIFLNIRWFLIKTGRGDSKALSIIQILFAITFLVTRVLLYNVGLLHMVWNSSTILNLEVPRPFLATTITFIVAGSVLNLFWTKKIWQMAFHGASGRKKLKK